MKKIKKFFRELGPGFITGASDDDPAGIATYSITGAMFGFAQLWLAVFSVPLMIAVQEMCGRIGLVTGKGLASVMKKHYSQKLLSACILLLLFANTVNLGADLGAMAAAAQLLIPLPFTVLLIGMTVLILILEIFVSYKVYAKYLKFLCLSLLAYIASLFFVKLNWGDVLYATFVPHLSFSKMYLFNIVAFLGTTISPYLFFWQASEEVEDEVLHHKLRRMGSGVPHVTPRDLSRLRKDTAIGMFFSQVVAWAIVVVTGATLYNAGIHHITSATEAAEALRPFAGDSAFLLFALGIIGTGFLVVPILSGSVSYAVAETFSWKEGLYLKLRKAHGFYGVITIATLVGLLINFVGINPFSALYYSAVVNGIVAVPLLIIIMLIANNKQILGSRTNGPVLNALGLLTIIVMGVSAVALVYDLLVH
ncbi:MAG: hypothetical protein RLZZ455_1015 [Candidatus Parcubacteria bacterium]|jgi:NRAMP (natural resistance-associated macrophage protein)-like metal ion transporter